MKVELISLYIHAPFCVHRCGYCDFNTYAGLEALIPAYTDAVCKEIEYLSSSAGDKLSLHTVYFGGGTPSLLPIHSLGKILKTVNESFDLRPKAEITLEANPGTVSLEYLEELHSLGISRLSFGMQSADQNELALLERQHSFIDVMNAVEWSRQAGIMNLNLDLIYGLPGQGLPIWLDSLEAALALRPEHLSLYALTLERGTPMQHKIDAGLLPEPDPDCAADMYEAASDQLAEAGYTQYEISNWAKRDGNGESLFCKHNLQYWHNLPYLGVGPGAHGFINNLRMINVAAPSAYILRMAGGTKTDREIFPRTPATIEVLPLDMDAEIGETMMMGLRLVAEGVSDKSFAKRFGIHLRDRFEGQIERLVGLGLLEWVGEQQDVLRLTKRGRLLGNQVFKEFI